MITKTQTKALLEEYNIRPKKRWGQNFLVDKNISAKIVRALDLNARDAVLEIGPGLGALTEEIAKRAGEVVAVEKDRRICEVLQSRLAHYNNFRIVNSDILKFHLSGLLSLRAKRSNPVAQQAGLLRSFGTRNDSFRRNSPLLKIIGNLPYYITTPIIAHLLQERECIDFIILTVQKEVAHRLISRPCTKEYGAISVFVQFYAEVSALFNISGRAFYPQPGIESTVLKLNIRKQPLVKAEDEVLFFKIVRAAFQERRKTLLNAIYSAELNVDKERMVQIIKDSGLSSSQRGETLSLQDFADLANSVHENSKNCI